MNAATERLLLMESCAVIKKFDERKDNENECEL